MAWNYYDAGIGNVGSYQASGHPWVTGSDINATTHTISLPFVSKALTIINTGSTELSLHFLNNTNAKATHYITIKNTGSLAQGYTFPIKCSTFYLTAAGNSGYQIMAELTRIDTARMFALTGSGIDE